MEPQNRNYLKLIPVLAFCLSVGFLWYGNRPKDNPVELRFSQVQEETAPAPPMDWKTTDKSTPALAVVPTPEITNASNPFWAKYSISAMVLVGAFAMLFMKKRFSASDLKWAYAMIGTVVGFWLR